MMRIHSPVRERVVRRLALLLLLGPLLVGACTDLGPVDERLVELEARMAIWDSLGPASYVYAVERLCFCGVEYRGPVRIMVEDGVAVERLYVDTGAVVPPAIAGDFPTVEGLFGALRSAIEGGADHVEVTYDPALGLPIDFWIDFSEMTADEEMGMRVTEAVAPLP